jgi:hypothetical protein
MTTDNQKLAAQLREVAARFRKEAAALEAEAVVKCAQVLIAARGLDSLKRILRGAER